MNTTKYLSMAAIALMGTLASCQSDDDITVARPADAVSVNFTVGSRQAVTRSNALATDDTQKQFNRGDQVTISTADQDPVNYQYDGSAWNEAVAGKFLLWKAASMTFQAFYPVTTGTSLIAFTLPTDQSIVENINAADYMTGSATVSQPNEVQMELQRQTARVIVTISGFNDQYSDADKLVSGVHINSAAAAIADGAATGSVTTVTPYASGTGTQGSTYTALLIPAAANASANFITLTDGEGNTLNVKGIPELQAGKSYTYSLTVGKNTIKVQSVTVVDWTTGETLAGGQAEEQTGPAATDLSTLSADYEAKDGDVLTGTLSANVKISIADGATVTLDGVTINGTNSSLWAGITLAGDGIIILSGTNSVKGFNREYPGIYVPSGKTLTIQGDGSLTASSNGRAPGIGSVYKIAGGNIVIEGGTITATGSSSSAGIGGSWKAACGNITIKGGTIIARGGSSAPGIGSGQESSCGTISITGGTVTATGGEYGAGIGSSYRGNCGSITITGGIVTATGNSTAGIGSGYTGSCGDITITDGVTSVTATKGSGAPNSIGAGNGSGSCGTVTIGGTVTGNISTSPYTYEP